MVNLHVLQLVMLMSSFVSCSTDFMIFCLYLLSQLDCTDKQRIDERSRQVEIGSVQAEVSCSVGRVQNRVFCLVCSLHISLLSLLQFIFRVVLV